MYISNRNKKNKIKRLNCLIKENIKHKKNVIKIEKTQNMEGELILNYK